VSEYRDDRQGLLARIAELETELARAEKRAASHVVKALRAGELEHDNQVLQQKLADLERRRNQLSELGLRRVALAVLITIAVVGAIVGMIVRR
jgi:hypothetical protein